MAKDIGTLSDVDTVEKMISQAQSVLTLSYYNTSILQKIDDIEISSHNIVYDYLDELLSLSSTILLTDLQFLKYKYRPDLLSYDIYGTIDYEFIILALNGMLSPKDFTKKKLKLLGSTDMNVVLNKIYNAENKYITKNRQTYLDEAIITE